MPLKIIRIPVLSDNYVWLVHEPVSGETMVVDPAVAAPVLAEADARGWKITQIWNTHWHPDHTGGNAEIKAVTGCVITGPEAEAARIPTLDVLVAEGDVVSLGAVTAKVIDVPAHTAGHIAFHFPTEQAAFEPCSRCTVPKSGSTPLSMKRLVRSTIWKPRSIPFDYQLCGDRL